MRPVHLRQKDKSVLKKLLVMYKMIHHRIPAGFHRILVRVQLRRRIRDIVNILILNVWVITGEEILSKQKLNIIYIGSEKNKNFLAKLAFGNSYKEDHIGKTWLWRIFKTVKARGHACSLMVAEVPKSSLVLFGKKKCFYIPFWVRGELNTSVDTSPLIKNESLKSDLRRIRRNKLHFELTDELSQFHNFYYNMYLPHTTKAHSDRALIVKYDFMKRFFRDCDLLLIKKDTEYIAGVLIAYGYRRNRARLWSLGVKDGNSDHIKDGAIGGIYYFSLLHLKEKGYKRVSVGASRAFLKDGVLRYKKKWGQKIVSTHKTGFLIKPLSKTAAVEGFFLNNPFIYVNKNRRNGAIFAEAGRSFSKEDFQKFYKDYCLNGMSKLFIYRFEESSGRTQEIVPSEFDDRITICSAESLF
jgi:hypothetical protein